MYALIALHGEFEYERNIILSFGSVCWTEIVIKNALSEHGIDKPVHLTRQIRSHIVIQLQLHPQSAKKAERIPQRLETMTSYGFMRLLRPRHFNATDDRFMYAIHRTADDHNGKVRFTVIEKLTADRCVHEECTRRHCKAV